MTEHWTAAATAAWVEWREQNLDHRDESNLHVAALKRAFHAGYNAGLRDNE